MAQHDYVIANQSGASFRADLNNALAAIVSNNSGASAPSTTYAYQWWADTTDAQLKLRNAANDGWIVIQELDGTMLMEDGTAASPGLAFASDLDTGFFRAGANQLGIATNGTERAEFGTTEVVFNDGGNDINFRVEGNTNANLFFVDAGNDSVGVGTSSPQLPFTIAAGGGANPATSGSTQSSGGIVRLGSSGAATLDVGTLAAGPAWLQATNVTNLATNYSLLLNPNGGNVGIGTTTAKEIIDARGAAVFSGDHATGANAYDTAHGIMLSSTSGLATIKAVSNGANNVAIRFVPLNAGTGSEAARIDSSGRLLLGTSTARSWLGVNSFLQVEGTGFQGSSQSWTLNSNDANGVFLGLTKSRGTALNSNALVADDDTLGAIYFNGTDGSDPRNAASILVKVDGTPGASDMPGRIEFATTADGASSPTTRMTIDSGGRVEIGAATGSALNVELYTKTTTRAQAIYGWAEGSGTTYGGIFQASAGNSSQYAVYGYVNTSSAYPSAGGLFYSINLNTYAYLAYWSGSSYWTIYGNGAIGGTSFVNTSDSRLKDVDSSLTGCLDKLANIQPVKYTWKENSQQRRSDGDRLQIGLLAEEVQAQFPELVSEMEWNEITGANPETLNEQLGTTLGVDYGRMTAVLIQALNEAKTRIETLEGKVSALENA